MLDDFLAFVVWVSDHQFALASIPGFMSNFPGTLSSVAQKAIDFNPVLNNKRWFGLCRSKIPLPCNFDLTENIALVKDTLIKILYKSSWVL